MKNAKTPAASRKQTIETIAARLLDIETLTPQNRDRLDFHEIHVTPLRRAMEEAWKAGARYSLGRTPSAR
jgi:hypothetical protein